MDAPRSGKGLEPLRSGKGFCQVTILLAAATWMVGLHPVHAQSPDTNPDHRFEIVVPAAGGLVQWQDVAESIAGSMTLDAESVKQMLPSGTIDLRSDTVMLMLVGVNLTFGDSLSIDIARDSKDQPTLRLRCRRDAFARALPATPIAQPKLHLDQDWQLKVNERPLVLCIHGMQGQSSAFDDFRDHLRRQGFPTAAVSYDFDQAIEISSRQIAALVQSRLKEFVAEKRSVDERGGGMLELAVVGHSMGGLIACECTATCSGPLITTIIRFGRQFRSDSGPPTNLTEPKPDPPLRATEM